MNISIRLEGVSQKVLKVIQYTQNSEIHASNNQHAASTSQNKKKPCGLSLVNNNNKTRD